MTTDRVPPDLADGRVEVPAADDAYLATLRRLTPAQKLAVAQDLRATAWRLKAAAFRARHPEWSEEELQARVRELFLYAGG